MILLYKTNFKVQGSDKNAGRVRYVNSFGYNKASTFLHNAAYILPAEFTVMECSPLCPKQLITKRRCPQLQLPPSTFSSSTSTRSIYELD